MSGNLKIRDFIDKFTINPKEDIEPYFERTKELDIDASKHDNCFNCNDKHNNMYLKSVSWTSVQYCWKCGSLNVIHHQDRMGGCYTDVIICYGEKN